MIRFGDVGAAANGEVVDVRELEGGEAEAVPVLDEVVAGGLVAILAELERNNETHKRLLRWVQVGVMLAVLLVAMGVFALAIGVQHLGWPWE